AAAVTPEGQARSAPTGSEDGSTESPPARAVASFRSTTVHPAVRAELRSGTAWASPPCLDDSRPGGGPPSDGRSSLAEGCLSPCERMCGASAAMSLSELPELPPLKFVPIVAKMPPPASTRTAAAEAIAICTRRRAVARREAACTSSSPKLGGGASPGACWNSCRRSRSSMRAHPRPQRCTQRGQAAGRLALHVARGALECFRRRGHVQPLEIAQHQHRPLARWHL